MHHLLAELLSDGFMPHGNCFLWRPSLVWLHVISDGVTALSYFSIPVALIYFVRKWGTWCLRRLHHVLRVDPPRRQTHTFEMIVSGSPTTTRKE